MSVDSGFEPALPTPPHVPRWVLAAVVTGVVFTAFITVGAASQLLNPAFGLWFTELFVFVAIPWVLLRFAGREPRRFTGLAAPSLQGAAMGLWLGVVNFFTWVVPIQSVAVEVFPASWREKFDVSQVFARQEGPELALLIGAVVIAAPLGEELFFRGTLLRALAVPGRRALWPLIFTSVIFSAFHFDPVGFVGRVELGVLFGWLYLRSGSLWPGVFAHAANNGVATALYFIAKKYAPQTPEEPELSQVLFFFAGGLIFFIPTVRALIRNPSLLGPGLQEEHPEPPRLPSPSLFRLALPWVVPAVLSAGLLFVLDRNGVKLNALDMLHPLPDGREGSDAARDELLVLRRKARHGEVSVAEYEERRRAVVKQLRDAPRLTLDAGM